MKEENHDEKIITKYRKMRERENKKDGEEKRRVGGEGGREGGKAWGRRACWYREGRGWGVNLAAS